MSTDFDWSMKEFPDAIIHGDQNALPPAGAVGLVKISAECQIHRDEIAKFESQKSTTNSILEREMGFELAHKLIKNATIQVHDEPLIRTYSYSVYIASKDAKLVKALSDHEAEKNKSRLKENEALWKRAAKAEAEVRTLKELLGAITSSANLGELRSRVGSLFGFDEQDNEDY